MKLILIALLCAVLIKHIVNVIGKSKASPEETEKMRQTLIEMHKNGLIE